MIFTEFMINEAIMEQKKNLAQFFKENINVSLYNFGLLYSISYKKQKSLLVGER